ncbi:hypothetical protein CEXT_420081 [Caerostris extrusa]|uniref:Uncharacterized protein n=1 Tax=Caerostris extrusa TaxID=172846 RepID=A0AAV4XHL5_CAEEX|nr:hypothetical protein CEXT_420081 [Caerostris extrusa]
MVGLLIVTINGIAPHLKRECKHHFTFAGTTFHSISTPLRMRFVIAGIPGKITLLQGETMQREKPIKAQLPRCLQTWWRFRLRVLRNSLRVFGRAFRKQQAPKTKT